MHPNAHRSRIQARFAEEPAIPRSPSSTCSSGKWPSAAVRGPELCLCPDFHAFNGAALQAGTRPEGFLFLSSSLLEAFPSSPDLPLPGGPPSALGSDRYYGRGEKGRTQTPPECRERFRELPWKKPQTLSPLCLLMCVRGCQLRALRCRLCPIGDGWSTDPPTFPCRI